MHGSKVTSLMIFLGTPYLRGYHVWRVRLLRIWCIIHGCTLYRGERSLFVCCVS